MTTPLGLAKIKQQEFFFVLSFVPFLAYAYAYDDPYVAGLTSYLCFTFRFNLMPMFKCDPGLPPGHQLSFHTAMCKNTLTSRIQMASENVISFPRVYCVLLEKYISLDNKYNRYSRSLSYTSFIYKRIGLMVSLQTPT